MRLLTTNTLSIQEVESRFEITESGFWQFLIGIFRRYNLLFNTFIHIICIHVYIERAKQNKSKNDKMTNGMLTLKRHMITKSYFSTQASKIFTCLSTLKSILSKLICVHKLTVNFVVFL